MFLGPISATINLEGWPIVWKQKGKLKKQDKMDPYLSFAKSSPSVWIYSNWTNDN